MKLNYDLKNPKRYYLVTIVPDSGDSITGICHSWHPHGAVRTVLSAPSTQAVLNGRDVKNVLVDTLDEYESIAKEDFCVQTSKDGMYWIITNISDSVVYKLSKAPRTFDMSIATLAYLNDEPVTDANLVNLYRRKLYIWVAKYGGEMLPGKYI